VPTYVLKRCVGLQFLLQWRELMKGRDEGGTSDGGDE
jgi:hypothetical protein